MVIPGFFCHVVVVIILVCLVRIGVFLKCRLIIFIKPGFTCQVSVAVPGLQLFGVSTALHQEISFAVTVFLGQEMTADIVGVLFQGISLCGNHGLPLCAEEFFGQQIAPSVIFTPGGCIIAAKHIGSPGFIKVFFAQQAVLCIIFPAYFSGTGIDICDMSVCAVIHFSGGIAVCIILTDEGGITFRAFSRVTVFIIIFLAQLMTFIVPGVFLFMISGRDLYGLVLSAIGYALRIAHIICFSFLCGIAKGSVSRFPIIIQVRNSSFVTVIDCFYDCIAVTVH